MNRLFLSASSLLVGAILTQAVQTAPQATSPVAQPLPATIEFNRDIRPILSDKCFQCHGPGTQMATLRFDSEDGAKHALKDGRFAIVPGEPARSQVIARITATNPAVRMPRSHSVRGRREPVQCHVRRRPHTCPDHGFAASWQGGSPDRLTVSLVAIPRADGGVVDVG